MISTLYFEHRRRTTRTREQLRDVAIMHRNIYHAVRAHDPERARREMNTHLPRPRFAAATDIARPVAPAVPVAARVVLPQG
jgi:GntR family transcriptional repressor for pyruvate dehydrogenase complex